MVTVMVVSVVIDGVSAAIVAVVVVAVVVVAAAAAAVPLPTRPAAAEVLSWQWC